MIVSSPEQFNTVVKKLLPGGRFSSIEIKKSVSSARRELLTRSFDLIIINAPLTDGLGVDFVMDIYEKKNTRILFAVPIEVFKEISSRLVDYGVITIRKPVNEIDLELSARLLCAVHDAIKKANREVAKLEDKLQEQGLVSRAKLILIQKGMSEDEAHEYIIREAMDRGLTKKAVAEEVIDG
jgi:response regulator NasT